MAAARLELWREVEQLRVPSAAAELDARPRGRTRAGRRGRRVARIILLIVRVVVDGKVGVAVDVLGLVVGAVLAVVVALDEPRRRVHRMHLVSAAGSAVEAHAPARVAQRGVHVQLGLDPLLALVEEPPQVHDAALGAHVQAPRESRPRVLRLGLLRCELLRCSGAARRLVGLLPRGVDARDVGGERAPEPRAVALDDLVHELLLEDAADGSGDADDLELVAVFRVLDVRDAHDGPAEGVRGGLEVLALHPRAPRRAPLGALLLRERQGLVRGDGGVHGAQERGAQVCAHAHRHAMHSAGTPRPVARGAHRRGLMLHGLGLAHEQALAVEDDAALQQEALRVSCGRLVDRDLVAGLPTKHANARHAPNDERVEDPAPLGVGVSACAHGGRVEVDVRPVTGALARAENRGAVDERRDGRLARHDAHEVHDELQLARRLAVADVALHEQRPEGHFTRRHGGALALCKSGAALARGGRGSSSATRASSSCSSSRRSGCMGRRGGGRATAVTAAAAAAAAAREATPPRRERTCGRVIARALARRVPARGVRGGAAAARERAVAPDARREEPQAPRRVRRGAV